MISARRYAHIVINASAAWLVLQAALVSAQTAAEFAALRNTMVEEAVVAAGVENPKVVAAMRATARHEFVDRRWRHQAYFDMALPIGHQQTISSPFIVAYMTQSLEPQPGDRVLEIGTGSGYQAAVLSPLVDEVYSIEIVAELGKRAERLLQRLGYENVFVKVGDGFQGWPEHAPFDKIVVTCSPEEVPRPLVEQLKEGGLMVIPVGQRYQQTLYVMRKVKGQLQPEALRPTLFVPMTGVAEDNRQQQPDPSRPQAVNGGFEEPLGDNGFVPGWYYQRNLDRIKAAESPQGEHFVRFTNEHAGKPAHLLQGFPIDGREVGELVLTAWVKYDNLWFEPRSNDFPAVAVTLYDENRKELGTFWIGPFRGRSNWTHRSKSIRVPPAAREGILRIGLFGATGSLEVDDVRLVPAPR